jgi:hypothetical protein
MKNTTCNDYDAFQRNYSNSVRVVMEQLRRGGDQTLKQLVTRTGFSEGIVKEVLSGCVQMNTAWKVGRFYRAKA